MENGLKRQSYMINSHMVAKRILDAWCWGFFLILPQPTLQNCTSDWLGISHRWLSNLTPQPPETGGSFCLPHPSHHPCQPLATVQPSSKSSQLFGLFLCQGDKMAQEQIWQEHAQPRKHWQQEPSFLVVVNCLIGSLAFTLKKSWKPLM